MSTATPGTATEIIDGRRIEYRFSSGDGPTAVVLHGGHMSAACRFGEQAYRAAGHRVLVVSRPGYGGTEPAAGPSAPEFVPRLIGLLDRLGVTEATAVGISLGARSALTLAAFAPDRVRRVILLCPTSFARWPEPRTRLVARAAFNPVTEHLTWGAAHALLRRDPQRYLPRVLASLTLLPPDEAVVRLGADRQAALDFLLGCRSGSGFGLDLRPPTDVTALVSQPVLLLATRLDGSVDIGHPQRLAAGLADARLVEVPAPTHLLWLGDGAAATADAIRSFLR